MSEAILSVYDLYLIFPHTIRGHWSCVNGVQWFAIRSIPMRSLMPNPRFDFPDWTGA